MFRVGDDQSRGYFISRILFYVCGFLRKIFGGPPANVQVSSWTTTLFFQKRLRQSLERTPRDVAGVAREKSILVSLIFYSSEFGRVCRPVHPGESRFEINADVIFFRVGKIDLSAEREIIKRSGRRKMADFFGCLNTI